MPKRLKEFVKRRSREREVSQSRYMQWLVEREEEMRVEEYPLLDRYDIPYNDEDIERWHREAKNNKTYASVDEALRSIFSDEVAG